MFQVSLPAFNSFLVILDVPWLGEALLECLPSCSHGDLSMCNPVSDQIAPFYWIIDSGHPNDFILTLSSAKTLFLIKSHSQMLRVRTLISLEGAYLNPLHVASS